jgi:hypothetical protein
VEGADYKPQKRNLAPAFSPKFLLSQEDILLDSIDSTTKELLQQTSSQEYSRLDIHPWVANCVLAISSRIIMGCTPPRLRYGPEIHPMSASLEATVSMTELFIPLRQIVPTPLNHVFDLLPGITPYLLRFFGSSTSMIMSRLENGNIREDLGKKPLNAILPLILIKLNQLHTSSEITTLPMAINLWSMTSFRRLVSCPLPPMVPLLLLYAAQYFA